MKQPSLSYCVAIHEAAHVVIRYTLLGNIDIIDYVSINQHGESLGRNKEITGKKIIELGNAYENDDNFLGVDGYAFKECCYSLAGVVAEKVVFGLETIPFEGAGEDLESLYCFLGMVCDTPTIDSLKQAAIPKTESLVRENIGLIERIADALMAAPDYRLNGSFISSILTK